MISTYQHLSNPQRDIKTKTAAREHWDQTIKRHVTNRYLYFCQHDQETLKTIVLRTLAESSRRRSTQRKNQQRQNFNKFRIKIYYNFVNEENILNWRPQHIDRPMTAVKKPKEWFEEHIKSGGPVKSDYSHDGARQVTFQDDTKAVLLASGHFICKWPNGKQLQCNPDGTHITVPNTWTTIIRVRDHISKLLR